MNDARDQQRVLVRCRWASMMHGVRHTVEAILPSSEGPLSEQLSALVNTIYSAAVHPERWSQVLGRLCEALDAAAALLVIEDLSAEVPAFWSASQGHESRFAEMYFPRHRMNPLLLAAKDLPCPSVARSERLVSSDELHASAFYQTCLAPSGWVHSLGANLYRSGPHFAYATFLRTEQAGPYDDDCLVEFGRLSPHLSRAIQIQHDIVKRWQPQGIHSQALQRMAQPVLLVSGEGDIVFKNAAAQRVLDAKDGLRERHGKLMVNERSLSRSLLRAESARASALLAESADHAPRDETITLSVVRRGTSAPLVMTVARLLLVPVGWPAEQRCFLVVLSDPDENKLLARRTLQKTFGLTTAELRVADFLVRGLTPEEIANSCDVTIATVRTHLARLYDKTDSRRQAELVAQLLAFSEPLLEPA